MHSILSSHISLPQLSDHPRQEQNPENASYAELQLGDTCSGNHHGSNSPTRSLVWGHSIWPHPNLRCSHIHTPENYVHKKQKKIIWQQGFAQSISRMQTFVPWPLQSSLRVPEPTNHDKPDLMKPSVMMPDCWPHKQAWVMNLTKILTKSPERLFLPIWNAD